MAHRKGSGESSRKLNLKDDPVAVASFEALTHLRREFKKWSDFHETSYTLPKGLGRNIYEIVFTVSSVVSEIWVVAIWQMTARTGTKLAHL